LFGSVLTFVSQPFERMLPSQSPHPASQVPVQAPDVQVLLNTWFVEHTCPQELQLSGSVLVFASQPFDPMLPSQLPHPATHVPVQVPAVQDPLST